MQPVEITLRYVVAVASFALAIATFRYHGLLSALPATLSAILLWPPIDNLFDRWLPELTSMTGPPSGPGEVQLASDPARGGHGAWRTAVALLGTVVRVLLCGLGILYSLYLVQGCGERATLHISPAPALEYRSQVTLDGHVSGVAAGRPLRLVCNGQPVAVTAGHFVTRQPLQLGMNTFRMVAELLDSNKDAPQQLEQTVAIRRVSEDEYDRETFGRGDCAQDGVTVRRSGAWGPGWPASRFAGAAELRAPRLRGRCVQELTASRLPVKDEAALIVVDARVGRGQVKVLLRHPDGTLERLLVTPDKPLHYTGSAQITRMSTPLTQPGNAAEGTPPATSVEEFWVAYLSLESVAPPLPAAGAAAAGDSDAVDVSLDARYLLK
jgi:hypothetical protein